MAKGKKDAAEQTPVAEVETPSTAKSDMDELREMNRRLMEQVQSLTTTLAITSLSQKKDEIGEPNVRVENVSGMACAFTVHDPRTGQPVDVSLDRRGAFRNMYRRQVEELVEKHSHFFEQGVLSAPDVTPDSVNVVRDPQSFIESCTFESARPRIEQITSLSTLFVLYHFVETLRWSHEDERGNALTEKVDGQDVPTLKEKPLPAHYLAVHMAVQRQIAAIRGVAARMDG